MQLEHSFTVPVGVEQAWAVLLDIERVAPCMPGAVLDSVDGDSFTGRVKIKLGPVNLTYKGSASFIEKDESTHRAVIDATGKDARGNGTAAAKVTATLVGKGDSTEVKVLTDLNITGKPAQFGRGVMVDVGNKLIGQFATCLEGKIGGTSEPPASAESTGDSGTGPVGSAAAGSAATPAASGDTGDTASAGTASGESASTGTASGESAAASAAAPPSTDSGTVSTASAAASSSSDAATRPVQAVRPPSPEPEPIDLLELAGGSVLTRLVPVPGGVLALTLLFVILRRRRR